MQSLDAQRRIISSRPSLDEMSSKAESESHAMPCHAKVTLSLPDLLGSHIYAAHVLPTQMIRSPTSETARRAARCRCVHVTLLATASPVLRARLTGSEGHPLSFVDVDSIGWVWRQSMRCRWRSTAVKTKIESCRESVATRPYSPRHLTRSVLLGEGPWAGGWQLPAAGWCRKRGHYVVNF